MNDRHFSTFHIAGFTYYNGVDVFENLKINQVSPEAYPEKQVRVVVRIKEQCFQ